MRTSWAVVVVLAACPGREPVNPSMTPAGTKPCAQMAEHVVAVMNPGGAMGETVDALRTALGDRCATDKWTIDAQQCFLGLKSNEDTDRCVPLLTVDQREAFARAIDAAIGKPPAAR
jgi:hypothetical protein